MHKTFSLPRDGHHFNLGHILREKCCILRTLLFSESHNQWEKRHHQPKGCRAATRFGNLRRIKSVLLHDVLHGSLGHELGSIFIEKGIPVQQNKARCHRTDKCVAFGAIAARMRPLFSDFDESDLGTGLVGGHIRWIFDVCSADESECGSVMIEATDAVEALFGFDAFHGGDAGVAVAVHVCHLALNAEFDVATFAFEGDFFRHGSTQFD
mmetsp:Transcript_33159/g.67548  ORF Transcript_33159/g.67548 Transcript_33159/m.67548 type:complete len:210 (+) Transcript_33159:50-679(+)